MCAVWRLDPAIQLLHCSFFLTGLPYVVLLQMLSTVQWITDRLCNRRLSLQYDNAFGALRVVKGNALSDVIKIVSISQNASHRMRSLPVT